MTKQREVGLLALGTIVGAFGASIFFLTTPLRATVVRDVSPASTRAGSDDVAGGATVREAPQAPSRRASDDAAGGTATVREAPQAPRGAEDARRMVGGVPAQIARVAWPASLEARAVPATSSLRTKAEELFGRVVPDDIARAASADARAAARAFIALGPAGVDARDPCVTIGAGERAALLDAYVRTQSALPEELTDYRFVCALVTDPTAPIDVTKQFPDHRRLDLEPFALRAFTRFFGRLPSKDSRGNALPTDAADRDWWAVKYLTYFPVLASARRDLAKERACIEAFTRAAFDLAAGAELVRKPAGESPSDLWEWAFVRACAYSGAPFLERFATR